MTFTKFSNLNVIQQKAYADAIGLTSNQLTDQLLKIETIGKSQSEIVALGGEDAAKRLEALSAQDKFNAATEKLKDLIGNLVAGPLGSFLDMISEIASIVFKIIGPIAKIVSFALKPVTGLLNFVSGGVTGALGTVDDMVGYGARTLSTPTGTVALNNNDTVIAGTSLFKGDDVMSFPKGKLNLGGGNNGKLEELMSTLIDVTRSTKIGVNLDGRAVGTGIVRATYQSA
jgi:hypothetical protein